MAGTGGCVGPVGLDPHAAEYSVAATHAAIASRPGREPPGVHVDGQMQGAAAGERMSDRVRGIVTRLLRDGEPSASTTASRMKMSVRTLNRALAAEGTSYRAFLDQLRHELACRHLGE